MPKQNGPITLSGGSIGGVHFYYNKKTGVYLAGLKTGVDGDTVKRSKRFEGTRRAQKEFAGVNMIAKTVTRCMCGLQLGCGDRGAYNRLVRLVYGWVKACPGRTGTREIRVTEFGGRLRGYEVNEGFRVKDVLGGCVSVSVTGGRAVLCLKAGCLRDMIGVRRDNATHVEIGLAVGAVSDLTKTDHEDTKECYGLKNHDGNGRRMLTRSERLCLDEVRDEELTLCAEIEAGGLEDCFVMVSVGVCFFQEGMDEDGGMVYTEVGGKCAGIWM